MITPYDTHEEEYGNMCTGLRLACEAMVYSGTSLFWRQTHQRVSLFVVSVRERRWGGKREGGEGGGVALYNCVWVGEVPLSV